MKITNNYILIILLGFTSCDFQNKKVKITNPSFKQVEFIELELKENCTNAETELNEILHDNIFVDSKVNRQVSNDTLRKQLKYYSTLDNFNEKNSFVCLWHETKVWQYRKKTNILKIERVETSDSLNKIQLIDYNIYFEDHTNFTTIRFLNKKKLIKIFDSKNEITRLMESTPLGLFELTRKQDSINTRTITCR